MAQKSTEKTKSEKAKPELDPSNLRLWVSILLFIFLVQNVFIPKNVLVRFIDHLLFGLIFQFLPRFSEGWQLVQHGLTYLIVAWLFIRAVHRPLGTIGASLEAWKSGAKWGLGALGVSAVLLFLLGGIVGGFSHTPSLLGFLPVQLMQLFNGFGKELCFQAFLQVSVIVLAFRYLKNHYQATLTGIIVSTIFFTIMQIPYLAKSGLQGTELVGPLLHTYLIIGILVSAIYALTNNLVLVSFLQGGLYFMSYWTVEGIYPQFPMHIFLLVSLGVGWIAYRSNPKALKLAPLAA
jgi:hypothetical protein